MNDMKDFMEFIERHSNKQKETEMAYERLNTALDTMKPLGYGLTEDEMKPFLTKYVDDQRQWLIDLLEEVHSRENCHLVNFTGHSVGTSINEREVHPSGLNICGVALDNEDEITYGVRETFGSLSRVMALPVLTYLELHDEKYNVFDGLLDTIRDSFAGVEDEMNSFERFDGYLAYLLTSVTYITPEKVVTRIPPILEDVEMMKQFRFALADLHATSPGWLHPSLCVWHLADILSAGEASEKFGQGTEEERKISNIRAWLNENTPLFVGNTFISSAFTVFDQIFTVADPIELP